VQQCGGLWQLLRETAKKQGALSVESVMMIKKHGHIRLSMKIIRKEMHSKQAYKSGFSDLVQHFMQLTREISCGFKCYI